MTKAVKDEIVKVQVEIPLILHCKIKGYASLMGKSLKQVIGELITIWIINYERDELEAVKSKMKGIK